MADGPVPAHRQTAGRDHCLAPSRGVDAPAPGADGKYGRLFPGLAPFSADDEVLLRLGGGGGPCDGGLIADGGGDDGKTEAGWPLSGQFVAHDITADRSLLRHGDGDSLVNFRTPRVNLESVYGDGPVGSPFLYDRHDPARLLVGVNDKGDPYDLPRNAQGTALIGDPRNDVHLFVSQLHLALLNVHNLLVDRLREDGVPEPELFPAARQAATWHYQWVVVHDFLPTLTGRDLVDELLADGRAGTARGDHHRSRWSSRTPPTGTATARSGAATSCGPAGPSCPCSRTCSACDRCRRATGSTGRGCSGSRASRHHSRARRSTGASHAP